MRDLSEPIQNSRSKTSIERAFNEGFKFVIESCLAFFLLH